MWVVKGSELYNRSMKSWLQEHDTEIYSTHKEQNLQINDFNMWKSFY